MKKEIISISGNIAGGKSEICSILADMLCMQVYAASQSFRALSREYNMSLVDFNEYIKEKPEIDKKVEEKTAEYARLNNKIILDARLGWYVVPESFKVYIKADIDVASKRLKSFCVRRGIEEQYETQKEAKEAILRREALERERYKKQYGIDLDDEANYDLVVDSSVKGLFEVANEIATEYKKWLEN